MEDIKVTKTDKELIQDRINELERNIFDNRKTGRTYRAINAAIDKLFNEPIGTKIQLIDTSEPIGERELHNFCKLFTARMMRDFPDTFFKISYPQPGIALVVRTTETYQETAKKRLEQWKKKLNEI